MDATPVPPPGDRSRLVDALIRERTVVGMILLNTIALCFLSTQDSGEGFHSPWFVVDYVCVCFFVLEAILKIGRIGWRPYIRNGWNRFDFSVVALGTPVLLSPLIDLHGFAVLLLLRLGRLFRLFRLLHFIPRVDRLAAGVRRALRASVAVFLALVLVNVILSIAATMLFRGVAPEHFDNPILSMYSVFRVFTVEGWYEIPDTLARRIASPQFAVVARVFFVLTVILGGLLGLSLANAVFVDEMTADNTRELEADVRKLHAAIETLSEEVRALRGDLADRNCTDPPRGPPAGHEP
jgi:voltage-gated sodium channel